MSDDVIRRAMEIQDRRRFLPADVADEHLLDQPLPIGHGQTNSQPSTVERMVRLLEPFPGMRVLDVGSGSGWTTAILAELGGPESRVFAVEVIAALVERSREAVEQSWASIHRAEHGVLGLPEHGPFDRILVSAMADELPTELVEQLTDGGILVAPWADELHRVRRTTQGLDITRHGGHRFVPLVHTRF